MITQGILGIGERDFSDKALASVTFLNSVEFIEDKAFKNNRLTSFVISKSIRSIGKYAFAYNELTSVNIFYGTINKTTLRDKTFDNGVLINRKSRKKKHDGYCGMIEKLTNKPELCSLS